MKKDKTIILRVDEDGKRLLTALAKATALKEAEVLRQLLSIGGDIMHREQLLALSKGNPGQTLPLRLSSGPRDQILDVVAMLGFALVARGRTDAYEAILDIVSGQNPDDVPKAAVHFRLWEVMRKLIKDLPEFEADDVEEEEPQEAEASAAIHQTNGDN